MWSGCHRLGRSSRRAFRRAGRPWHQEHVVPLAETDRRRQDLLATVGARPTDLRDLWLREQACVALLRESVAHEGGTPPREGRTASRLVPLQNSRAARALDLRVRDRRHRRSRSPRASPPPAPLRVRQPRNVRAWRERRPWPVRSWTEQLPTVRAEVTTDLRCRVVRHDWVSLVRAPNGRVCAGAMRLVLGCFEVVRACRSSPLRPTRDPKARGGCPQDRC